MKIGISLSGGGARGIAHLGILQALAEANIHPDKIVGVSAGSLVGALYGQGYSPFEILEIVKQTNLFRFIRPSFSIKGLLDIRTIAPLLKEYIPHNSFEGLQRGELVILTTDIYEGEPQLFSSGKLIPPMLASSAIPVIFNPIEFEGKTLIDGGVIDNLPYTPVADCDFTIGAHINPFHKHVEPSSIRSVLAQSLLLTIHRNARLNFKKFDVVIEPLALMPYHVFNLNKADEIFEIGYQHTFKQLPAITAAIEEKKQRLAITQAVS
ncbi:patatin-like phospholipase family protein [Eisenibacter elegans]|jgi:NTE family protein|uniref:patatin-like phospholipase family protein n=1 Tax=Eisenibacter elegans TaxID=997 RepID=UPI00047BB00B|nr:patatin-like phospholipase family protein [Eisenibacter elegans]